MKKLFLFILLSTLLFANLLPEEKEYLEKKGSLKVCYTKYDVPFVIEHDDKISGISIDFLDHITKDLDIKYEMIKTKNLKEKREFLQQNKCDILPMVPTNINKYSFIKQTTPLGDDHIVLVTNIFEPYLFDLKTLKNKKVAIRKGAINIKQYVEQNYPNLQIVE
ncbi:MAG: transporter substrate-binding domain-containing protein, partial [Bacteroidales bacterium]|nr:transporter substrate-binding domain-containing protein [Bacteroidales bacterium]